jgi:hypothetical protein
LNFIGPEPTYSLISWNGSVLAMLLQAEAEAAVVERFERVERGIDALAHGVAHHPALEAGQHVARGDFFTIMPFQALAQLEGPDREVGVDLVALAHLGLGRDGAVHAIELVPHHHRRVAHHVLGAGDGVHRGQIGLGDEFQDPHVLREAESRGCQRGGDGDGRGQERTTFHGVGFLTAMFGQGLSNLRAPSTGRPECIACGPPRERRCAAWSKIFACTLTVAFARVSPMGTRRIGTTADRLVRSR